MNFLEFKRRLMVDPRSREPEFLAARQRDEEFARAAAEADAFESKLDQALEVPVPDKLAEDIILRQSMEPTDRRRSLMRYAAAAAMLAVTIAVTAILWVDPQPAPTPESLYQHLAWHWEMDGVAALEASRRAPSDQEHVRRIFGQMGVHLDHELVARVRLSKFCPTPDGAGVHAVLETDQGPVTLFYMPRTRVSDGPQTIVLPDGMEAWAVNLEHGSMALVAEAGSEMPELAGEIKRQLHFPPGINL